MQYAQFLQWAVTKEAALLWQILHSSAASESSQNIKKSVYQLIALSPDIHFLSLATELLTKIWMVFSARSQVEAPFRFTIPYSIIR